MENVDQWARELVDKLEMTWFSVATFRADVLTSNGGKTVIRPEKKFKDTLMALVKEKKSAKALAK